MFLNTPDALDFLRFPIGFNADYLYKIRRHEFTSASHKDNQRLKSVQTSTLIKTLLLHYLKSKNNLTAEEEQLYYQLKDPNYPLNHNKQGARLWPLNFSGSVSHGEGLILAVVSQQVKHLAVDIEAFFTHTIAQELINIVADLTEINILNNYFTDSILPLIHHSLDNQNNIMLNMAGPTLAMTGIFSAKECLFKLLSHSVDTKMPFNAARLMRVLDHQYINQSLMLRLELLITQPWGHYATGERFIIQQWPLYINKHQTGILSFAALAR